MSTFNYHYKKRLPAAFITAVAVAGVAVAALPFTFVNAQENNKSPVADIVENFFKWRGNQSSSSVFDIIPPGIAKKIFDHYQMPGSGNDETDPTISDIETDVDEDEVTISWSTDERTRGVVYISDESPVDEDDDDTITLSSWKLSREHSVSSDDLDDDTTYYALIKATDKAGNETYSSEQSFNLNEDDEDDEAPVISNLDTDVTDDDLTVTWDTDEDADSVLYLSTTTPVDPEASTTIEVSDATLEQDHELTALNLEEDTTYYGIVTSTDAEGNTATSSQFTVTTDEDDDDPVITNVDWDASSTSINVSWNTNEAANSHVYTSTSTGFAIGDSGVQHTQNASFTTSHNLTITGLNASTTYYHKIVSIDEDGNEATTTQYTIATD
jgi:hypothetical protein